MAFKNIVKTLKDYNMRYIKYRKIYKTLYLLYHSESFYLILIYSNNKDYISYNIIRILKYIIAV